MMKVLIIGILAVALVDPGDIRKINSAKAEAKKAYLAGDFKTAIEKYRYLTDSVGVDEEEVRMNLANAYFQANDTTQAYDSYLPITQSKNPTLKSVAHQQMGVLNNRQGKFEEALNDFKQALKANPANEDARFNYEMVKKKLEEKKKQEQQQQDQKDKQQQDQNKDQKDQKDQNKDQQQKDQEKKDQDKKDQEKKDQEKKDQQDKDKQQNSKEDEKKDQEQKEKDQVPPSVQEKLKDMNMSEEKAKMILEAMKAQEVQYLQQNKRKATKPKDKGKPDW
jgi:tetratricopeptide (TPR) repeat protein